jgi:hypothetical protein
MKKRSIFRLTPIIWVLLVALAVFAAASYFVNPLLCAAELVILAAVTLYTFCVCVA